MNDPDSRKVDYVDFYVGQKLMLRRVVLGLSQKDLAKAIKVSTQQIQKYEKAYNRISCGKLFFCAKVLNVPISYFFDELEVQGENYILNEDAPVFQTDIANEKEITKLIYHFRKITSSEVRQKIVEVVMSIATNMQHI